MRTWGPLLVAAGLVPFPAPAEDAPEPCAGTVPVALALPDLRGEDPAARRRAARAVAHSAACDPELVQSLDPLVEALDDPDPGVRADVACAIRGAGMAGADAVTAIRSRTGDADPAVRECAYRALAAIDLGAASLLAGGLSDPHPDVRGAVIRSMGDAAAPRSTVVRAVVERLADGRPAIRAAACAALAEIGAEDPAAELELRRLARDTDGRVRFHAARALSRIEGPDTDRWVAILVDALDHSDAHVRIEAARALADLGERGAGAIPGLERAIARNDPRAGDAFAEALRAIGGSAAWSQPDLISSLEREDEAVQALVSLRALTADLRPAFPRILGMLHHEPAENRVAALRALASMGPEAGDAVPELIRLLEGELEAVGPGETGPGALDQPGPPPMAAEIASTLGSIGLASRSATSLLERLLRTRNPVMEGAALGALSRIGYDPTPIVSGWIESLRDPDPSARRRAMESIAAAADAGYSVSAAIPTLGRSLHDSDPHNRAIAAQVIWGLRRDVPELVRMYESLARDRDRAARLRAASLPVVAGPAVEQATEGLREEIVRITIGLAEDRDLEVRVRALRTLAFLGPRAELAVPYLLGALEDPEVDVVRGAAVALGWVGHAARPSVPALRRLVSAGDLHTRAVATEAIERIETARPAEPRREPAHTFW